MNAQNVGTAVDVAATVSLLQQMQIAQRSGEEFDQYFKRARKVISKEDRSRALTVALFALTRLTWNEPDRLMWALQLEEEIAAFAHDFEGDES